MELQAQELLTKLQKRQPLGVQLLVVVGEDDYYRKRIIKALPDYVFGEAEESDREISVFEKDTDLREFKAALNNYPFFAGQSLLILSDEKLLNNKQESESNKEQLDELAKLLADVPDYCTVLVTATKLDKRKKFYKQIVKQGLFCDCKPIKSYAAANWLAIKAQELGGHLDRDALNTILEYISAMDNAPLELLTQELEKLAIYCGERHTWTKEDVQEVFAALPDISGWSLNNALVEHKLAKLLQLLAVEKRKNTNVLPLCGLLLFGIRKLLRIQELEAAGVPHKEIGNQLRLPPSMISRNIAQARSFQHDELLEALLGLEQLNLDLRAGGRQYDRLEEILVQLLHR